MSSKAWNDFIKAFPDSVEAKGDDAVPIVTFACSCEDRRRRGQMFLTPTRLYFLSHMLGVMKVEEELAAVTSVIPDEKDKINKAVDVTLSKEEPATLKFLSFREDVATIVKTILEKSAAARAPRPTGDVVDALMAEARSQDEPTRKVEAMLTEAEPVASCTEDEQRALRQERKQQEQRELAELDKSKRAAVSEPVDPQATGLRQRPPGMTVPKTRQEDSSSSKANSVIDSIRQRQQKEKLERQQYAERLRQKAESQSRAMEATLQSSGGSERPDATEEGLEALFDLLPLTKRFLAIFGVIFVSTCFVMPGSVLTETYTDIVASALFLAALDVAVNPVRLASLLAELSRPHIAKYKAQVPAVSIVSESLHLVLVPFLHFLMLWLVEILLPGFSTGFFSALLGVMVVNIASFVSPSKQL